MLTDLDSFFSSKNWLLGRNGRLRVASRATADSGLKLCFVSEVMHTADTLTGFNIYVQYESIPLYAATVCWLSLSAHDLPLE